MTQVPIHSLALHPAADRVPMADASDLSALRQSLREHGQQDPIDVNEQGQILDGRTRWTLLKELGISMVEVRPVEVPPDQQTNYIVDRALARRHLNAEQKRALNALLREVVVEVAKHPVTGEVVTIGHGQSKRARVLGVDRETVKRWDGESRSDGTNAPSEPTHQRVGNGRIEPIHKPRPVSSPESNGRAHRGQKPVARKRHAPPWTPYFTSWCRRSARPEDRKLLLRLDAELHDALRELHIECEH